MIRNITSKLFHVSDRTVTNNVIFRTMAVQSGSVPTKDSTMDQEDVLIEDIGNKGIITLNRSKALNALNLSMIRKIHDALKQWEFKKELVILKGAGQKAFCAGGDVKSIVMSLNEPGGETVGQNFFREEYALDYFIGTYKVPYIALINGITMGGGVGVSVHGKYRIATENTLFAMPETAIGLFPDVGTTYFLPKLKGQLGIYLGLTGHRLKGIDVLSAGIATHYIPSERNNELVKDLMESETTDIGSIIEKYQPKDLNHEFSLAPYSVQINKCFSAPTVEEIINRLKADGSEWAENIIQTLNKMSPTSLKVTKKALEIGSQQNLEDCFKMEYRLAYTSLSKDSDFYEGVRALLIDKDQKPVWKPSSLSEVTDERVMKRFTNLPPEQELHL